MKIGHVELPVEDPLRSLTFYRDVLGFQLEANQADRFIWMTSGEVVLLLRPGPPRPPGGEDETPNVVLYTNELDRHLARLTEAGVRLRVRGTCHYFQDPDGHWFQLVDPGDDHSGS